ncbi:chromate transporter, partial [bacterium]|nr:chromate transporter [bacterium]
MIYLQLFYEFFKIGLFSFGGGYATIPFLFHISEVYNWYSLQELSQITAVASVTPGPVGINAATYAGLKTAGLFGAFVATFAEVLPSLILVIFVS